MQFPETYDFTRETTTKAQALKVLEEAAELVEADKNGYDCDIVEEALDVLQALANYLQTRGYNANDLETFYETVFIKNWQRNYYDANMGGTLYEKAKQHAEEMGLDD